MYYTPTAEVARRLANDFTYHAPHGNQAERYGKLRELARLFANELVITCPQSRELSVAMTNLDQVVFWANASIARNEPPEGAEVR